LSYERFLVRCEKADPNNGTNSFTWINRAEYGDPQSREEALHATLRRARGPYEQGKNYWVEIYPE
jgi:hypothetical protein